MSTPKSSRFVPYLLLVLLMLAIVACGNGSRLRRSNQPTIDSSDNVATPTTHTNSEQLGQELDNLLQQLETENNSADNLSDLTDLDD